MPDTFEIPLTKGKVAVVDIADAELLSAYKWHAWWNGKKWYAKASPAYRRSVLMHRLLTSAPKGVAVDHVDGDGLNNTRGNIRLATYAENVANSGRRANKRYSKYKGVFWAPTCGKWFARVQIAGRYHYAKTLDGKTVFISEDDAARGYNELASQHHGEFARLNEVPA